MYWILGLLSLSAVIVGHDNGPDVVTLVVKEGSNAILPCSLSTKENIEEKVFDWKKNKKEVFLYEDGLHYNSGRTGQDEEFKGRVSHFPDQLKFGNSSIIIRKTTVTDSGTYTCVFPHLQPERQTFIRLVVERTFKDRSGEILGASPEPDIRIINATEDGVLLQCEVRGAFPKPVLQWKDSDGKVLPAEEPQVMYRKEHYYVTLLTTVTKTTGNRFFCVVTQDEISHRTEDDIYVPFCKKTIEDKSEKLVYAWIGGWISGVLTVAALLALIVIGKYITNHWKKGSCPKRNDSDNDSAEELNREV